MFMTWWNSLLQFPSMVFISSGLLLLRLIPDPPLTSSLRTTILPVFHPYDPAGSHVPSLNAQTISCQAPLWFCTLHLWDQIMYFCVCMCAHSLIFVPGSPHSFPLLSFSLSLSDTQNTHTQNSPKIWYLFRFFPNFCVSWMAWRKNLDPVRKNW